ncbi:hypothetical protein LCGC14_3166150 [marine sediment metagenome]|uniref:DUF642 domain-containing protein n=1 Tax=marine sediment metagenome TaxID=412755 RepID=A0A0F8VL22_9ZZZZ
MAQFARPDSDVTLTNFDSPFWSNVDEVSPDDDTTSQRSGFGVAAGALYELTLSNVTDPVSSTGHVLRVRHLSSPTLVTGQILIELRQGASTVIASATFDAPTSYTTFIITLSGAEADSITDYTDLRVRGTTQVTTNFRLLTTWIEFEVPDAPGGLSIPIAMRHYMTLQEAS